MHQSTSDPDRTSDAFIRHVAHDLRASLNVVVSWAELVRGGQLPAEELPRAGETIVRHARQLSQRLSAALDVWRLDNGLLAPAPRRCAVGAMVSAAMDETQSQFESRRIVCALELQRDGHALVDSGQLTQALAALMADAAVNTTAGHRVDIRVDGDERQVVVRIVGGGRVPGERAFDRNPAETRAAVDVRPFDFGLALARALVVLNGGTIGVEPADSDRVAFVVTLPAARALPAEDGSSRAASP